MRSSESNLPVPQIEPAGGDGPSLELLAVDFIDVNRSLTLATQLANLTRLWTLHTQDAEQDLRAGLGGLGAIAGEIDRLLLDCQYLLPRLAEVVDRHETDPEFRSRSPGASAGPGATIVIDGVEASLRARAVREYGGDIAVAAADLTARAVLAAETRRLELWQEFGQLARGSAPSCVWRNSEPFVIQSLGTVASLREWLADSAQATVAWLSRQLGIR